MRLSFLRPHRLWLYLGFGLASWLAPEPVRAQAEVRDILEQTGDADDFADMSLEDMLDVVVTTTRTEENLYETPGIVTVVTRQDLDAWGYRSVAEVLRHLTGFYVIDDHMQPNLAVRGISGGLRAESSIVKVMVDGVSVAFRPTAGNWLSAELLPMAAIERIEIVRGPSSSLYGADAFLGVINIITRSGASLGGGDLRLSGMAVDTNLGADQDLAVGMRQGPFEAFVATRLSSENRSGLGIPATSPSPKLASYSRPDDTATDLRRNTAVSLLRLSYHFEDETRVQMSAYVSAFDAGHEFADWLQLARGYDERGRFNENRSSLAQGSLSLTFDTSWDEQVDLALRASYLAGGVTPLDRVEAGSGEYWVRREFGNQGVELDGTLSWTPDADLMLLANASFIYDQENLPSTLRVLKSDTREARAGEVYEPTSQRQGEKAFVNPGVSVQGAWKPLGQMLALTAGGRYDFHNIYGHHMSGRLALVSTPAEGVHLKLVAGNAYKAPTPYQLYATPYRAGDLIGNASLKPQDVYSLELQITNELSHYLVISLGAAYQRVTDAVEFTPRGVNIVASNVAGISALSIETEAQLRLPQGLVGYVNLAVNTTRRSSGEVGYRSDLVGDQNVLYPPIVANSGLRWTLPWVPVRAGVELSSASSRRASADNILAAGRSYRLPAILRVDANVSTSGWYPLSPGHETQVSLIGRNLLDERGPDPGFGGVDYPLQQRTVLLQLRQVF